MFDTATTAFLSIPGLLKARPAEEGGRRFVYPSIGGEVLEKVESVDPVTKMPRIIVKRIRWTNIGLSRTPVNPHVSTVSTVPFGVLAKCWAGGGLDLTKTRGTATAARPVRNYWDFRDRLAGDIRSKRLTPTAAAIVDYGAARYGLGRAEAAEWTERFLADLERHIRRKIA